MFALGMLPQRMEHLKFTRPYLQSGIYAVSTKSSRVVRQWADIDKPGVLVAVQAGTFMEPVMAGALKQATMVVIKPGTWHHGPFSLGSEPANILVALPERTYANDTRTIFLEGDDGLLIASPRNP
jgi:hypothetical protein